MRYPKTLLRWTACLTISFSLCSTAYTQHLPDSLKVHLAAERPVKLTFDQARQVIKAGIEARSLRYQVSQLDSAICRKDTIIAVLQQRLDMADKLVNRQARTIRWQRGELWVHRTSLLTLLVHLFIRK